MTYQVTLENRKSGSERKVTVEAADKFEAMAKAENKGWAAVDSRLAPGAYAGIQPPSTPEGDRQLRAAASTGTTEEWLRWPDGLQNY